MRVAYNKTKYLQRQRVAFMQAQEQVFPDKRDLRKALDCTYAMYKNYSLGLVPLPDVLLFNLAIENPDMVTFADIYIRHLWSVKG